MMEYLWIALSFLATSLMFWFVAAIIGYVIDRFIERWKMHHIVKGWKDVE